MRVKPALSLTICRERYQAAYQSLGYYCSVVVACRYAVPSACRGEPGKQTLHDIFERAVALTVLEHPLLQVGAVGSESKRPSWVRLDRIDLRNHLAWHTVEDASQSGALAREISQAAHNTRFADLETRPGWKINAVYCPVENHIEAVLAYSHSIGDGTSGKVFHLTLLEKLNVSSADAPVGLEGHILELPPVANFTPTSEELLKTRLSPAFVITELFKHFRPQRFSPALRGCNSWAPIRPGPLNTQIRVVRVENKALQGCLKACRQHGTTLTGLIHALALASLVARTTSDTQGDIQSGTPISLRRFVRQPGLDAERTIANCVSYCFHRFGEGELEKLLAPAGREETIWATAAHVREDLVRQLDGGTKNERGGMLKFISDHRSLLARDSRKPRQTSLECSNLGVLDGGAGAASNEASAEHGSWTIDQALFSQSACAVGPGVSINPLAVQGKGLCITFCWQGGVVSDAVVEGLASTLR